MRQIITFTLLVLVTVIMTSCQYIPVLSDSTGNVYHFHAVTVDAKHFFPKHVGSTSVLGLFNYKEEILPDRYVVEFYDESDSTYHFVRVCKFFWDRVEPGDTLYYNDTTRVLKISE